MNLAPFTHDALRQVMANLSAADRAEIEAARLDDPVRDFLQGADKSVRTGTVLADGVPVAVFGCVPWGDAERTGVPWMVCTEQFRAQPRRAMELSHQVIAGMREDFAVLTNYVHCHHDIAIRWLKRLGFSVREYHHCGPGGQFYVFEWRRGDV